MQRYPYYEGVRAQTARPLRYDDPVGETLSMVQAIQERGMSSEDRDSWEGWMTCTWEQGLEFLGRQADEEADDRMAAVKMMGAL